VIGYFVTGTDTNVGKTYVTCALARRATALGHRVFAFKPMETGCVPGADGELVGADQELLAAAAGGWQQGALRGMYRLRHPAAPLVAAESEGTTIDLDGIVRTAREAATRDGVSFILVEGAGGWRVPITPAADMSTLARALGLPVLIVARAGLGTINHTLLTVEAVKREDLPLAGVVLSERPEDDPDMTRSNCTQIGRRWPGRLAVLRQAPDALDVLIPPKQCST
jgi:dethiobiotin synthetase